MPKRERERERMKENEKQTEIYYLNIINMLVSCECLGSSATLTVAKLLAY